MVKPRILLSSVFKPFGVDNIYSRKDSKIELFHNQLTKYQDVFSMRTFMSSYGLHAIANNIEAPTTVLDFPGLRRFENEVAKGYDYVGISSIVPNFQKVKRMVELVREVSPRSKIIIGGFCAAVENLDKIMDVDHVCVGEGISFMRELLGEAPEFKFKNPDVFAESRELLGVPIFWVKNPHIITGLGCSYGCDFCSPSHFFSQHHIRYIKTGQELFDEMVRVTKRFGSTEITFIGDDNFFMDMKRARELRDAVVKNGRMFNIFLFGSANLVMEFGIPELAEMGVYLIWIGRESRFDPYPKNRKIDLKALLDELRKHGIKTILSSILFLDNHTQENIWEDIDDHLACRPDFSQFAHYSPAPGTPLWERMKEEGRLLRDIPFEDCHAFKQPWFVHPQFSLLEAEKIQDKAYLRDFHELGPSLLRWIETDLIGYEHMIKSPRSTLQKRAEFLAKNMKVYRILIQAIERLALTPEMADNARELRTLLAGRFGSSDPLEKTLALGLTLFGLTRRARTRLFGDAIQPRTRITYYNY